MPRSIASMRNAIALAAWTRDRYVFEMSAARWAIELAVETGQRQAGIEETSRRVALQEGLRDMPDSVRALVGGMLEDRPLRRR